MGNGLCVHFHQPADMTIYVSHYGLLHGGEHENMNRMTHESKQHSIFKCTHCLDDVQLFSMETRCRIDSKHWASHTNVRWQYRQTLHASSMALKALYMSNVIHLYAIPLSIRNILHRFWLHFHSCRQKTAETKLHSMNAETDRDTAQNFCRFKFMTNYRRLQITLY